MFVTDDCRDRLIHAFTRFATLSEGDRAAIGALDVNEREASASTYLVREGQRPSRCAFLLEGFVYRQKLAVDGTRSIVSLHVPGDFVDLQNLFLAESDHDVLALTRVKLAEIAIKDLRELAGAFPTINRVLWLSGLIEASIYREWLLNLGRRNARARVGHLLCEISARLEAAGLARELTYELPMTQEQLGDALGLTAVHINRILRSLEKEGLIRRHKREVAIADWQRLRRVADFDERYLHLASAEIAPG